MTDGAVKITFDDHNIEVEYCERVDGYEWFCDCFGNIAESTLYYETAKDARIACEEWIRENGIRPYYIDQAGEQNE